MTNGAWAIQAGGTGVGGTSDSFRLASETNSGDTQVTADVTGVPTTAGSQAGLMVRQRNDPGSPLLCGAGRAQQHPGRRVPQPVRWPDPGGNHHHRPRPAPLPDDPAGRGQLPSGHVTDGVNYTLVTGSNANIPMPTTVLAGLAVSSGANGTAGTGAMSAVTIGAPGTPPSPPAPATACPPGWGCQDVGNPLLVGNQSLSGGTWTLTGAGNGIDQEQPTDQFHYVWQTEAGDATVSAQVLTQTVTDPYAAAGVMMRTSTAGNASTTGPS